MDLLRFYFQIPFMLLWSGDREDGGEVCIVDMGASRSGDTLLLGPINSTQSAWKTR
jgi:hypothetical protein